MRIILTGASGWIGSYVADILIAAGHEVHALIRPTSVITNNNVITHVSDAIPFEPDLLICLAWIAKPNEYLTSQENLECLIKTQALLNQCSGRVVVIGTCFEYDTLIGKLSENGPVKPLTLYSYTKNKLRECVQNRSNYAYIRLFYQYGPKEHQERFVPKIILKLLSRKEVQLSGGQQLRDYLHVYDVANAIVTIALSNVSGIFNVGSGKAVSQYEIATTIGEITGRQNLLGFGYSQ